MDKNSLLTKKYFDYIKLKKALAIFNNNDLSKAYKNAEIQKIKDLKPSSNYMSPAWNNATLPLTGVESINNVMTKYWLVGFIEAEGSFYLVKKDLNSRWNQCSSSSNRIQTVFSISSKNIHILGSIRHILHIKNQIIYNNI